MVGEASDNLVGRVLRGKYTLQQVIGRGGMATVYRALHRNGSRVAVKILHPDVARIPLAKERFLREGYAANKVEHPGTVRVLDDDVDETDGLAFIVMEILEGESLANMQARLQGAIPPERALHAVRDLLFVLESAHARGIVHRDIKPDNIFLTTDGVLKVLDFGIARVREADGSNASMTQTGSISGTPAFMSPEQALGRTRDIDAQTDVWAAGATLFSLLTNRFVHLAETMAEALIFAGSRPAPLFASVAPSAPPALAYVIDRSLAFHKQDRFQSAREMREALEQAAPAYFGMAGHPSVAPLTARDPVGYNTMKIGVGGAPAHLVATPEGDLAPPNRTHGLPGASISAPNVGVSNANGAHAVSTTTGLSNEPLPYVVPPPSRLWIALLPAALLAVGAIVYFSAFGGRSSTEGASPSAQPSVEVAAPVKPSTPVASGASSASAPTSTLGAPSAKPAVVTAPPRASTTPPIASGKPVAIPTASSAVIHSKPKKDESLYAP